MPTPASPADLHPALTNDTDRLNRTRSILQQAGEVIAPVWPLEHFVAVNPYLGLTDRSFEDAARRLADAAGARTTLPAAFYLDAIDRGQITEADLDFALAACSSPPADSVEAFLNLVRRASEVPDRDEHLADRRAPIVASVARSETGRDWERLMTERISAWAAAYFDRGQALWRSADASRPFFASWRREASFDRTPEVMGLPRFREIVQSLPEDPIPAATRALKRLDVPDPGLDLYLHRLLMTVGGWAAYAARIVWDAQLRDREDDTLVQFLAVLLCWDACILETLHDRGIADAWANAKKELVDRSVTPEMNETLRNELILQTAFDHAAQRRLIDTFAESADDHVGADASGEPPAVTPTVTPDGPPTRRPDRPRVQSVFCIDVRSEVFRRHFEATASGVETIGFAGFFGFPIEYVPIAHEHGGAQCPVLLTPGHTIQETIPDRDRHEQAVARRRLTHHVRRAWTSFKMGAISCFSFVGPVGLAYLPKMLTDTFGWTRTVPNPDRDGLDGTAVAAKAPSLTPDQSGEVRTGIPPAERLDLAEGALRAMSLTEGFARLVMITGHGATTVNNPYDTGLDCGACGGHAGAANARVAAAVLNDPEVRQGLAERGIEIPNDTVFLACQHDTTTDAVTIYNRDAVPAEHHDLLHALDGWLEEAGGRTRRERARRFHLAPSASIDDAVEMRSRDWAEVRPEWGLAGCSAFIVAPRHRTAGLDLEGRAFLHSYDWRQDQDFDVLELIMTAPMVVASWISLQYYASTVDNRVFGSGNKTLHNVVGKVGVFEGNGGDLRVGLPWQSVHDGEAFQHEPLRLSVVIEAPIDAMNDVLSRHASVQDLCDHGWLHLWAMDDAGRISHRYNGDRTWWAVQATEAAEAP